MNILRICMKIVLYQSEFRFSFLNFAVTIRITAIEIAKTTTATTVYCTGTATYTRESEFSFVGLIWYRTMRYFSFWCLQYIVHCITNDAYLWYACLSLSLSCLPRCFARAVCTFVQWIVSSYSHSQWCKRIQNWKSFCLLYPFSTNAIVW